jgi:hypothetical protein
MSLAFRVQNYVVALLLLKYHGKGTGRTRAVDKGSTITGIVT